LNGRIGQSIRNVKRRKKNIKGIVCRRGERKLVWQRCAKKTTIKEDQRNDDGEGKDGRPSSRREFSRIGKESEPPVPKEKKGIEGEKEKRR